MSISQLHIVKRERYDPDMMDIIIHSTDQFSKTDIDRLKIYKKHKISGNTVEVVYHFAKGCEDKQLGRLYVKNNIGLQSFPSEIRNSLLNKYYFDIDIENAQYNIMIKLASEWNIPVDNIRHYCENRDACLAKISSNRRVAKNAYIKIAFGGNIKMYNDRYVDDIAPEGDISGLKLIDNEVKLMMDVCYMKHPEHHKLVKNKSNPRASLFAYILQTEERKCILAFDEYLILNNRKGDIIIHDSIGVEKLPNEIVFPEELIQGGMNAIYEKTGHSVKLVHKKYDNVYTTNITEPIIIDDAYAAEQFIKLLGKSVVRDGSDVYYYNDNTGMWGKTDIDFRMSVSKYKDNLIFYDKENNRNINYGGIEKNVSSMKKWIVSKLIDTHYITDNIDTSLGKILFTNGYYDFVTDKFTEGFSRDIIFLQRINRPYPKIRNEELINKINDILFISAFNNDDGLLAGDYLKKALCMGIYGDYTRKKFYIAVGLSNTGKGVLVNAMTNSFEGYIDEYDANNLLYNQNCSTDEAKRLAWLKDLNGVRLAFSNEIRFPPSLIGGIDGNLLKSLSSGGDNLKIRGNYESQKSYVNRSTMFLLANDVPNILPVDSGIITRCSYIKYKLRFVENPQAEDERLLDAGLKLKFKTIEYRDALIHLMQDTYKTLLDKEKCIGGKVIEPSCVIQETKAWISDETTTFVEHLKEVFEITHNPEDYVESKQIIEHITKTCNMKMSTTKIGMLLKKLIKLEKTDAIKNNKRVRLGIKEV